LILLMKISEVCLIFTFPAWIVLDALTLNYSTLLQIKNPEWLTILIVIDAFCNFTQSLLSIYIVKMLTPLSCSVANATKRVIVIFASILCIKNPVTIYNVLGMLIAITGVFCYSKVKSSENQQHSPERSNTSLESLLIENDFTVNIESKKKLIETKVKPLRYLRNVWMFYYFKFFFHQIKLFLLIIFKNKTSWKNLM